MRTFKRMTVGEAPSEVSARLHALVDDHSSGGYVWVSRKTSTCKPLELTGKLTTVMTHASRL